MLKISEELEQMSASGDFGVALDGVHERVAALEIERDALKAELKATQSRLHEVAVGCANAEFELEAARKQDPAIYRLRYTEATSGWVDVTKEVYDRHKDSQNYDAKVFYASPVPAQQSAEVTPAMLRAAQLQSELGGITCSKMAGAYSLITELYEVMHNTSLKVGEND